MVIVEFECCICGAIIPVKRPARPPLSLSIEQFDGANDQIHVAVQHYVCSRTCLDEAQRRLEEG